MFYSRLEIGSWNKKSVWIASFIHLPGMFRSSRKYKVFQGSLYRGKVDLDVEAVEIIKLRNTMKSPCDENTAEYDDNLVKAMVTDFGCKPHYLNMDNLENVPNCTLSKELADVYNIIGIMKQVPNTWRYCLVLCCPLTQFVQSIQSRLFK